MQKTLYILIICFGWINIQAQETHLGLRIGLNYSHFNGTPGENVSFGTLPGFHIGPTFSYSFSDIMGLRGELIFSQKGSKYAYDGPSYFGIRKKTEVIPTSGTRKMNIAVNNNYIDLPVMFYTLLFERIDVAVGGYASVLVGSTGRGDLEYSGKRDNSSALVGPIKFLLDQNFYKDKAGSVSSTATQTIKLEGDQIILPEQIGGYYEYVNKPKGSKYNVLDYGLTGSVHYRASSGLYIGARYQWGLTDVSNDDFDISYKSLTVSKEFILVPEKYKNRSLQFSIMLQL